MGSRRTARSGPRQPRGSTHLELAFDLGRLAGEAAEEAAFACGASAVTFVDKQDDAVLEPAPGEVRLWPDTRVKCLFAGDADVAALTRSLAAAVGLEPEAIAVERIADRAWEREWLKDFHAMRFGERLWICPRHERVEAADAVVVTLDPGLAFGTGTHASTALCLGYLDAHRAELAAPVVVIDYGCGSGILALAAVKLGAGAAHCYDIDRQARDATRANAAANGIGSRVHVHLSPATLPSGADLLLANILAGPLCALAGSFARLLRPGGALVLAGLQAGEDADVTAAYATCFDVNRFDAREGWVCLTGRRR